MLQSYLHKLVWIVGLALVQGLVLNHVHIAGYATPFIYVYLLLKIESDVSRNSLMMWGFLIGLLVDLFSDTPGMNASAMVLLGFLQPLILRLFAPRDVTDNLTPSMRTMGVAAFAKYLVACILIHHSWLLSLEFFSWAHASAMLWRILASGSLSLALILALEGIQKKKN